jgi:transposase
MLKHKSEDYKLSAVNYYLTENNNQLQTYKIFKYSLRSLMRWVNKYKQTSKI